jgi:hypothetical protein
MTWAAANVDEIAARWRMARRLYPIYSQIDRTFEMGTPPSRELESPIDRLEPEVLEHVNQWFRSFDEKIRPHHVRHILQTAHLANPENLRDLLNWQLAHPSKSLAMRDKVDYLVVQYFAQCAPAELQMKAPSFDQVADVLCEVLGDVAPKPPPFSAELEKIIEELNSCSTLAQVFDRQIIQRERALKERSGGSFFLMPGLVAFARCNYLLRHAFFRLLKEDLAEIRNGLDDLQQAGRSIVDASSAGLSRKESLESLRNICDDWKKEFLAEYSPTNFRQILQISLAIKSALTKLGEGPVREETESEKPAPYEKTQKMAVPFREEPFAAPPPLPKKAATPAVAAAPVSLKVEDHIDEIAQYLITVTMAGPEVMNIVMGHVTLALASWEVDAFVHLQDKVALAIQRVVAARLMLQKASQSGRTGQEMAPFLAIAHGEAALIQERIAEAKDEKDVDGAGRMAASDKRLLAQIEATEGR